jgi:energy-coupling factor transporter ATP-binding protein EcfA2
MISLPDFFEQRASEITESLVVNKPALIGVELIRASDIRPQPIQWLWEGWLAAGKLHILGGNPGTGKTTLALSVAAILSNGGLWADGSQAEQGNVVIWSAEDSPEDTLIPRLLLSGANLNAISVVGCVREDGEERAFDPARDIPRLKQSIESLGGVRLLVIDPIVSAVSGNDHKNSEVRRNLQPIVDMAASVGCAVLGITHLSKGTAGRSPLERITGSLAFGALPRLVWMAAKFDGDGDRRMLMRAKSNIGADGGGFEYRLTQSVLVDVPGVSATSVRWCGRLEGSAKDLLGFADDADQTINSAMCEAEDFLLEQLSVDEVRADAVAEAAALCGIKPATLRRAKAKLGVVSRKDGVKGSWFWSLPSKKLIEGEDAHKNL